MRTLLWIVLGWIGVTVVTAFEARLQLGALPDPAVIVMCFLALRRTPIQVGVVAIALGYLTGRAALAPVGLHASALVFCALAVYAVTGQLVARGAAFYGLVCAATNMLYHLSLYFLVWIGGGIPAFSGWAAALLVPSSMLTGMVAGLVYPLFDWLDQRLSPQERTGVLSWR